MWSLSSRGGRRNRLDELGANSERSLIVRQVAPEDNFAATNGFIMSILILDILHVTVVPSDRTDLEWLADRCDKQIEWLSHKVRRAGSGI